MLALEEHDSEVAQLLARFRAEYEAAQLGLSGFACTSPHKFITSKMENMWRVHVELQALVGDAAMGMIVAEWNQLPDPWSSGGVTSFSSDPNRLPQLTVPV
jgi:hypothetical protein